VSGDEQGERTNEEEKEKEKEEEKRREENDRARTTDPPRMFSFPRRLTATRPYSHCAMIPPKMARRSDRPAKHTPAIRMEPGHFLKTKKRTFTPTRAHTKRVRAVQVTFIVL